VFIKKMFRYDFDIPFSARQLEKLGDPDNEFDLSKASGNSWVMVPGFTNRTILWVNYW